MVAFASIQYILAHGFSTNLTFQPQKALNQCLRISCQRLSLQTFAQPQVGFPPLMDLNLGAFSGSYPTSPFLTQITMDVH